jgi:hypothetical protein
MRRERTAENALYALKVAEGEPKEGTPFFLRLLLFVKEELYIAQAEAHHA